MAIKIAGVDIINDDRELVLAKLTDIHKTENITAVDVFVYDTSKDSDGGAWRHRTQHTSWYNETLNTSTRGSRKEFPSVAVIVAEASKVTIYDGDDSSLPMWMVFNAVGGFYFNQGIIRNVTPSLTAISALNGTFCYTSTVNGDALWQIKFVSDFAYRIQSGGTQNYLGSLADRNSGKGVSAVVEPSIVNNSVNDVAMTVLPDAPTDPATGLPVPTIAVATAGGVSVIKDDGTVVDSSATFGAARVSFDDDGGVWWCRNTSFFFWFHSNVADYSAGDGFGDLVADTSVSTGPLASGLSGLIAVGNSVYGSGTSTGGTARQGLYATSVDYSALPSPSARSLNALTTSDYTTGWMPGSIKLAALADTTAETLDGNTFSSNFDNFTLDGFTDASVGTGTADASSGDLVLSRSDASNLGKVVRTLSGLVIGETYKVQATFGGAKTRLGYIQISSPLTGVVDYNAAKIEFTANSTSAELQINPAAAGSGDLTVSEVIFGRTDPDRSVNNNGLIVNGSITKAPVATGADVMAYSGFSPSNYLSQPYNSDLDFGTGDFCVMGWFKTSSLSSDEVIFNRSDDALAGSLIELRTDAAGNKLRCFTGSPGYNNLVNLYSSTITTNTWALISLVRVGASLSFYINGQLDTSGASSQSLTNTAAKFRMGIRYLSGAYSKPLTNGSLALLRISATAPTADQIKKIYEDEKVLFQENAKATLYYDGTSSNPDAVTALAHDPVTDLLHVGTSSGRSVFQGLRRVDNTTTAVSTAISANDSLIVEQ